MHTCYTYYTCLDSERGVLFQGTLPLLLSKKLSSEIRPNYNVVLHYASILAHLSPTASGKEEQNGGIQGALFQG